MSTFPTQPQSLCNKPLEENPVCLMLKATNQHILSFPFKPIPLPSLEHRRFGSHGRIYIYLVIKKFYQQDQASVVFFHGRNDIKQNYGLLFSALKGKLQWCSTKLGVLQKAVLNYNSSALLSKSLKSDSEGVFFELSCWSKSCNFILYRYFPRT